MHVTKLFAVALLLLSSLASAQEAVTGPEDGSQAKTPAEAPEVIVVTGRLPGPALWKVSNGDNVMWMFGTLDSVPAGMQWESPRVEQVLMQAEEYIAQPSKSIHIPLQLGLNLLNPFNLMRISRMQKRLLRHPDGQSLQAAVTPELYQRFSTVKSRYFPWDGEIEDYRPLFAGTHMVSTVLKQQGLVPSTFITNRIDKLAGKNRQLVRTDSGVDVVLNAGDPALEGRIDNALNTLPRDKEIECFVLQLEHMEIDVEAIKRRANAWARGNLDELREIRFKTTADDNPCASMMADSSEGDIVKRANDDWLATAERVLEQRHISFAVLDIGDLLSDTGLLAQLRAKGYQVTEPQ